MTRMGLEKLLKNLQKILKTNNFKNMGNMKNFEELVLGFEEVISIFRDTNIRYSQLKDKLIGYQEEKIKDTAQNDMIRDVDKNSLLGYLNEFYLELMSEVDRQRSDVIKTELSLFSNNIKVSPIIEEVNYGPNSCDNKIINN